MEAPALPFNGNIIYIGRYMQNKMQWFHLYSLVLRNSILLFRDYEI